MESGVARVSTLGTETRLTVCRYFSTGGLLCAPHTHSDILGLSFRCATGFSVARSDFLWLGSSISLRQGAIFCAHKISLCELPEVPREPLPRVLGLGARRRDGVMTAGARVPLVNPAKPARAPRPVRLGCCGRGTRARLADGRRPPSCFSAFLAVPVFPARRRREKAGRAPDDETTCPLSRGGCVLRRSKRRAAPPPRDRPRTGPKPSTRGRAPRAPRYALADLRG